MAGFLFTIGVTNNVTCRSCKTPQAYIDLFFNEKERFSGELKDFNDKKPSIWQIYTTND